MISEYQDMPDRLTIIFLFSILLKLYKRYTKNSESRRKYKRIFQELCDLFPVSVFKCCCDDGTNVSH